MRSKALDILGGTNVDDNVAWSCEDTINYIPRKASSPAALTPYEFIDAPGLRPFVMGPTGAGPGRGSHDCEGKHFVVMGSTFYQITNAGIAIPLGTVPGTQRVNISHNQIVSGNQVIITTGTPNGYVYNTYTQVFGRIIDPGYPGGGSVDYIDTYIVSVEPFGRYWFWSDQADATSYNTLNRTEAEADPDSIVGLAVNSFEVVVFGQNTVEFFYNAGGINGSTFRSKKVMNNHGCAARDSIVKLDNSIFWLGVDGILYRLNGYQAQPISSPQFTQRIAGLNWAKAFAFAYEDQGHVIYYITFPDGQTWGYDVTTGLTVRRESYGLKRWRLNTLTKIGRNWIGGDFQGPLLYTVDWRYPMEGEGTPLVRERYSGNVANDMNKIEVPLVELLFQTGSPEVAAVLFTEQPDPPTITGDAPDSEVNEPRDAYVYILGGGTPPYNVTTRPGNEPVPGMPALAPGATLPAGTPTTVGTYNQVLRNTDANGLWAELTDPITITPEVLFSIVTSATDYLTDVRSVIPSLDGTDWTDPPIYTSAPAQPLEASGGKLLTAGTTIVAWGGGSAVNKPTRTTDFGVTWTESVSAYTMGFVGCAPLDAIIISAHSTTMWRSTDGGATFANVGDHQRCVAALSPTSQLVVARGNSGGGVTRYSADSGATWAAGPADPMNPGFAVCGGSDGTHMYFGGKEPGVGTEPKLYKTLTGVAYIDVPLPVFATATYVTCFAHGGGISVIGTDSGEIAYDDGSGFVLATDTLGTIALYVQWNGVRFVMLGDPGSGSPAGVLKYSADGDTWTNAPLTDPAVLLGLAMVSA